MRSTEKQYSFQTVIDTGSKIREVVESQMRNAATKMVYELFRQEVERLCGALFSRKIPGQCHRGGSDPGSVLIQGQRVSVRKPRVKQDGQDVDLETYEALQDYDVLCERVVGHMLAGVSTRNYDPLLDDIAGGTGLSKSSVSEAFVRASKGALDSLNSRDLQKYTFLSIMIDGIGFGDRTVVVALGIRDSGEKMILGIREGSTENWEICRDLLESLVSRGLKTDLPVLFVIDGSKALKKAIRKVFGGRSPIQRCVRHKERNILRYLPKERHAEFGRRWKELHGSSDYTIASRHYEDLKHWLGGINHAALESLQEAERETMTVIKMNLPPMLRKTLLSTNPLESAFSVLKPKVVRVKNWRSGPDQIARWAATTLLDAETKFRKVRGFMHMYRLIDELKKIGIESQTEVA